MTTDPSHRATNKISIRKFRGFMVNGIGDCSVMGKFSVGVPTTCEAVLHCDLIKHLLKMHHLL